MKKIITMLLAMAMMLSLAACGGNTANNNSGSDNSANSGDAAFTTVVDGKLYMATSADFPPYEMIADDGSYIGIDVEVATAIAEKLGLELVIEDLGFDAALLAVQNGKSDIAMAGITVTEDRDEVMDFSDSYATGVQVVIVKEDSAIQSIDDLANAEMIGCQKATTGYIYASDTVENGGYGEDHVTAYDTGALAVMALANGQIDAVIIDNGPAQAYVAANPSLTILEGEWVTEDYCLAVDQGNTALLEKLNTALEELIADGTVQSIVDKYITE